MSTAATFRGRAETLTASLPPLLVAAERVASTVAQGVHGRRRVGSGETFWQFRNYRVGDPASAIDWRQSAKSDRVFVREHEWEAAQSVWLWSDASPSMDFRQLPTESTKLERAALLSLATAVLLVRAGEYVARLDGEEAPATGRATLTRLGAEMDPAAKRNGATPASLPPKRELPRAADVVLVSDFLSPMSEIEDCLRGLAAGGVRGTLMQVLDPAELELPYTGNVRFEGLEEEPAYTARRADHLRGAYTARLAARHDALADLCRQIGWVFLSHRSDRPPESALLVLYLALAERQD